ncbi:MAG: amino acid adenylation domain-containing protein, partial [Stigonema ocellatum SAG 48.90 = DSM 106950]|nr:amino acid adenylation domain-containing protein [Stigonema ocellatum SAG 48.90 = DSM 106950]
QTNYPLTLVAVPGDELLVKISYDTVRFEEDTIKRMLGHLQTIFSAIVENPQQTVGEIPLLSAAERHQLLVEWNDTESEYLTDKCIHELFSQQVELTPDAIALVFEDEQLTYSQLNTRANTIAHHLQSQGVKPDVLVGLCVKRSPLMVVGLLGILKAGGTYLPLDPAYPIERLRFMIKDAQVALVLTQQNLLDLLSEQTVPIVCLDNEDFFFREQSPLNPISQVTPDHLAYVMYTSGSTGTPKGVPISHHSLATHCQHIQKYYGIDSTDRVLQFTSLNFDPSLEQIFTTLIAGATLFVRDTKVWTAAQFTEKLLANRLSVINLPPAYWQQLIQHWVNQREQMLNHQLKLVIVGGEEMPPQALRLWNQSPVNGVRLLNVYGPTEATIIATCFEISGPFLQLPLVHNIPIGRPLANRKVYILDTDGNPVPIGVPGELHLGGFGLSRGYLHQKELSQEKFLTDPFSNKPGSRLYKTGDLARYLSDGNIEYLGRIDNQVKIRGFRIELGEIEAVLNTHPQIQQAVVIATEEVSGNKRLVGYAVLRDETLSTNQLREFLQQKLPEYMVPAAFVTLDTLPLTPNGKIDFKALPAPDGVSRSTEYVEPRTAIEEVLTNIWQQLLLKEKVSIHDNFFEIGGDSILSIQVVSRAKDSGVQITPKQIFLYQTIAELARVANTTVSAQCKQGLVTGVAPLTPIQHWFKAQNREDAHHYNQSVLLQIPNNLQSEFIEIAWKKLIEHHDALRLRFTSDEHKQINGGKDDKVPFAVVDLSSTPRLSQPEAIEKIATSYQASLNLSTGPIMQVVMFNLGSESDARLLIIIHHLAVDGVSWRILLSDLEIIYQQLIAQKPIELGAKTTAFIDWAEKLNKYAQSETLKLELDYWLNQPWSLTTPIPLDYAQIQQENTVGSAATVSVKLSPEETQTLLLSVNEAYNTQINDILLTALVKVLAEWTLNSTVLIDLEGHGREELFLDVDLSRTVGWFTSVFPVLLQLPKINQPASVIKSIKEQLRAIPNRGIGYGILRYLCEWTTVHEKLQTIPTSEIGFNYLGQFDQVQSQTGWKFAPESTGTNQSLKQSRDHLLDINALVVEGELQINWTYSSHVHT